MSRPPSRRSRVRPLADHQRGHARQPSALHAQRHLRKQRSGPGRDHHARPLQRLPRAISPAARSATSPMSRSIWTTNPCSSRRAMWTSTWWTWSASKCWKARRAPCSAAAPRPARCAISPTSPSWTRFEGKAEASYGFTSGGDPIIPPPTSTLNVPIIDGKLAVRGVFYNERQGGYIDNVPSTFTRSDQDLGNHLFRHSAQRCRGLPRRQARRRRRRLHIAARARAAGQQFLDRTERISTPTTYTGGRLSALYQIDDDWNILIAAEPGKSRCRRPFGRISRRVRFPTTEAAAGHVLLAILCQGPLFEHGLDRQRQDRRPQRSSIPAAIPTATSTSRMDYTNYSRSGGGMYYQCVGGSTGWGTGPASCYSPVGYWQDTIHSTHLSNEVSREHARRLALCASSAAPIGKSSASMTT